MEVWDLIRIPGTRFLLMSHEEVERTAVKQTRLVGHALPQKTRDICLMLVLKSTLRRQPPFGIIIIIIIIISSPEDMFLLIERGKETERETLMLERNIDLLPPVCALTRIELAT